MSANYFYEKQISSSGDFLPGEYEQCHFEGLDLSSHHLSAFQFIDCSFSDCNLSLANVFKTAFRTVSFKNCKMLGIRFDTCNDFNLNFNFEQCLLDHCSFYQLKIKKTVFKNCSLKEADFSETDLQQSVFEECDLKDASFERSNLEKSDFSTAFNYLIDPDNNRIKKARFSLEGLPGLLMKYDIKVG